MSTNTDCVMEIVFYRENAPLFHLKGEGLCEGNAGGLYFNVSELECFIVRLCLDTSLKPNDLLQLTHAHHLLDRACISYLKWFKTGEQEEALVFEPDDGASQNILV